LPQYHSKTAFFLRGETQSRTARTAAHKEGEKVGKGRRGGASSIPASVLPSAAYRNSFYFSLFLKVTSNTALQPTGQKKKKKKHGEGRKRGKSECANTDNRKWAAIESRREIPRESSHKDTHHVVTTAHTRHHTTQINTSHPLTTTTTSFSANPSAE
jgi:ABC-type nickel/cobalt efflux system permease component RcnA